MDPIEPRFTVEPPRQPQRQLPGQNRGPIPTLFKTGGTMLLSIAAFCLMSGWSWQISTGIVVLIFVHEMGHFIAAKCYGIPVSAPMFIPFVGAYVMMLKSHLTAWNNAVISYAGPLAGGLGGWVCYYLAAPLGWPWLLTVAWFTFLINLGNLAPIPPLDGSHIWTTFSRKATPDMSASDRAYMGLFLALLIAGLLLGLWASSASLHHH